MIELGFMVRGEVPSKKNAWRRGTQGQVYLPAAQQRLIDDLHIQLNSIRSQWSIPVPLTGGLAVHIAIYTDKKTIDVDNQGTTMLDLLQKAGIIHNDRDVVQLSVRRYPTQGDGPKVELTIAPAL